MFQRDQIITYNDKQFKIIGMVYKPDGSVDWYNIIYLENLNSKDPYSKTENIKANILEP